MAFNITAGQKEEIRRLTQKANRRINAAFKEYEAAGLSIVPKALTGSDIQTREDWESKSYALSRSVKFDTKKDYYDRIKMLKQFDVKEIKGGVPTLTEYRNVNANKVNKALNTALKGGAVMGLPPELMNILQEQINKMSVPEMSKFWKMFSERAKKLGLKYSSDQAMNQAMNDFFGKEEIRPMLIDAIINNALGKDPNKEELANLKKEIKFMNNITLVNYLKKITK